MSLIMDSGAFSAWAKGKKIDFEKYIAYLHEFDDCIDYIVNLDVIPGFPGLKKIPKEIIEASARQGYRNYRRLMKEGFSKEKVIHVFHQNEDFKWLERMVKNIPYIGLSPANDRTTPEKIRWLDHCMKYVLDEQGLPRVKFHGFAVTSYEIMKRYPWYSVDSASWCMQSSFSQVWVPVLRKEKWDFSRPPVSIKVNQRLTVPPEIHDYFHSIGLNFGKSKFKEVDENYVLKENERKVGKGLSKGRRMVEIVIENGIVNNYEDRYIANAHYIKSFNKTIPQWPWAWKNPK